MMTCAAAPIATVLAWTLLATAAVAQPAETAGGPAIDFWTLVMASAPAVLAVGWVRMRRMRLGDALSQLRVRHAGLIASALRMREASGLVPLLAGYGPQVRLLNQRFRQTIEEANQLSAELDRAEGVMGRWRLTFVHGQLEALEQRVAAFEREVAEVEAAMRGLHADVHECMRRMSVVTALHAELEALVGKRDWGWDQDVREALAALGEEIIEAERQRNGGDPLEALRRAHEIQLELRGLKQRLEARQASLTWLESAAAEAARLAGEERRLAQAGFQGLPAVDVEAVRREAEAAVAALKSGRLDETAAKQQALRQSLKSLRGALVGREERYWANRRDLAAMRTELAAIEAQLQGVHEADGRQRYPHRYWRDASDLAERLRAGMQAVAAQIQSAEAANAMQAQDFDRAHDALQGARDQIQELRLGVARCQAMWQALPQRERLLRERTLSLLGRAAEVKAGARQLGAAIDPRLQAMLDEVQATMAAMPLDLDEATLAIAAAETTLDRYKDRLASIETRLERQAGLAGRPVTVTLTRVETMFESEEPEGRRR